MTTSIFLIGNEFHFVPPHFSAAEKRKHHADKARERKKSLKAFLCRG